MLSLAGASYAQPDVVGIWRASLVKPATGANAAKITEWVGKSSMKLNKDKTFGIQLLTNVMMGTWSLSGSNLTLSVKEVLGKSKKDVAALPPKDRTALFVLKGGKLYMTPPSGKNALVWKKKS